VTFYQQENSVQLNSSAVSQEIVLTGFRSGSCKGVHMYMVDTSLTANPLQFILPRDVEISYAGNVIHRFNSVSHQLWDTLFTDVPSYFDNVRLTADASPANTWSTAAAVSGWVHAPFSSRFEQLSAEYTSVSGALIANGVLNVRLTTPTASANYKLYYIPYYEASLVFNNGNCEYVF
jgi:hypothetical protein